MTEGRTPSPEKRPSASWSEEDDHCAECGAYNDPMGNDEAISRMFQGKLLVWCGDDCLGDWVRKQARKGSSSVSESAST